MANIVVAALVITKRDDGSDLYLYEGSELPSFVSAGEVKRLMALGMVEKVSAAQSADTAPTAESN